MMRALRLGLPYPRWAKHLQEGRRKWCDNYQKRQQRVDSDGKKNYAQDKAKVITCK